MARRPAAAGLALALLAAGCAFVPLPGPAAGRPGALPTDWSLGSLAPARAALAPESAEPEIFGGFVRLASVAAFAAVLLTAAVPTAPAEAARSGGRMGGMGSAARRPPPPPPRAAQQSSGGRTNINIGVSPMMGSGFGYGGFGGYGYGGGLFAPPIVVPVPFGGSGPSASDQALQKQQRTDERQMDGQSRQIEALQKELADLKAKK